MSRVHRNPPARAPGAPVAWRPALGLALGLLAGTWVPAAHALPLAAVSWATTVRELAHAPTDFDARPWTAAELDGAPVDGHGAFRCDGDDAPDCADDDDPWVFMASHLAADLGGVHLLSMRAGSPVGLLPVPGLSMGDASDPDLSFAELEAAVPGLDVARTDPVGVPEPGTIVLVLAALGLSLLPGFRQWAD